MNGFSNEVVTKEYHRLRNMFFIGLFLVAVSIMFIVYGTFKERNIESISLADQMENGLQTDLYSYIDVNGQPFGFAYFEGEEDYYFYYVFDENYMYIVRMKDSTYESLFTDDTTKYPIRISGITKTIPEDIKEIAIDVYNEDLAGEYQITASDFTNYFNNIYLDAEALPLTDTELFVILGFIAFGVGVVILLCGVIMIVRYKKNIKKFSSEDVHKIDEELNDKDAFFYKNAHVALTKNYIVNFGNTFDAIDYKNIVWIYPYEIRQYGVKTCQSIQIMTKDGQMHSIANLATYTKKLQAIYDEIYETLVNKSVNALVGYSKENKQLVKEKLNKKTTRK